MKDIFQDISWQSHFIGFMPPRALRLSQFFRITWGFRLHFERSIANGRWLYPTMKGAFREYHYLCCSDNGLVSFCYQRIWCPGSLRRVILILMLVSLVACLIIYHVSSYGFATVYTPLDRINLQATTTIYRKRLRFHGTQRRLPQAIIIGARKCGTRALIEMLALHSYVLKNGAEMHFFDNDDFYEKGLEWYRKKMPYSFDNQITIEKTPSYFISKEAPSRIRAMNETMKLLLIVREPTYRVISDYAQVTESKRMRGKPYVSIEQKVFNEDGEINEDYSAIKISQYFVHMVRWLRSFPLQQIHIIDGEKLVQDPFPVLTKVEEFLNLPKRFTPWNFYFNHTKGFYCLRNETMQKCLPPTKGRKHPLVNPQLISRLRKYFAPFNDHFYELIGQNFSWPTL